MTKKFDVVIGNPPYQEEAQGAGTRDTPIYHKFMDMAYEVGSKVVLITPARFLFNAGFTPKQWNDKMLADPHLTVSHYEPNSNALFPGTDIKGGIAVTYRDESLLVGPIGTFAVHPELHAIINKALQSSGMSLAAQISSGRSFRYTEALYVAHPELRSLRTQGNEYKISTNTFAQFESVLSTAMPDNLAGFAQIFGLNGRIRENRWIPREFLTGPEGLEKFKVVVAESNGAGVFGEALSNPLVLGPQVAVTETFITIGAFEDEATALACLKYIKSKFARALLGVLKKTQHNPAKTWKYVPSQDFAATSDIDWSQPASQIDKQLYSKYGLCLEEIEFIETNVQSMDQL